MKVVRLKLKDYMDQHHVTQAKLAKDTKLAPNTIKSYYHGDVIRAELRVVALLCDYLMCDLCDIMVLEEKED